MPRRYRGRPRRSRPDPELEALGRFGRLVAVVIVLELAVFLWLTGGLRPL